jgi:hypothetical protein
MWTVVETAGCDSEGGRAALEGLVKVYGRPLLNHLMAKFQAGEEDAEDPDGLTAIPEKLLRCPRSSFSPFNQHWSNSLSLKPLPLIALETSRSITSIEKCRSFCAWAQKSHRRVGRKLSRAIPSDSNLSKINTGEYMRIFQNLSAVWDVPF